jgi:hypothetical protein
MDFEKGKAKVNENRFFKALPPYRHKYLSIINQMISGKRVCFTSKTVKRMKVQKFTAKVSV